MKINYERLPNGVMVATDEMQGVETVAVSIRVQTGSVNEKPEDQGVSHFLEHMAFKGTKTRTALDIAKEFDEIGGNFNAYTSHESTVYYAKTLRENMSVSMSILADILQSSKYDENDIEKEREVILQEIAMTNDTPDDIIFDMFQEVAYPNQSFGRSILGTVDIVSNMSKDQILRYVENNHYNQNIIISAAGKIKHSEFLELVNKHFHGFKSKGQKHIEAVEYKGGHIATSRDLEQNHIILGFESVPFTHPDYYSHQVLSLIAGGGMSSRLFQEVREKRGLAYSVGSAASNYSKTGMFSIYAGTSMEKSNEYMDVVIDELQKLRYDITSEEIERAKSQVRASLLMGQEGSISRVQKLSGNLSAFGRYLYTEEVLEKISEVDKTKLEQCATELFSSNNTPTLASIGKIDKLYKYEDVKNKLSE
jgi:predicted Zn-dependent peptidase